MSQGSLNFPVTKKKQSALRLRMRSLGIMESDLEETFVKGGGPGGQKINKTSSTVVLRDRKSGTGVRCGEDRSQALNRYRARVMLCDQLELLRNGSVGTQSQEQNRIRRNKDRRSRRAKRKLAQ